MKLFIFFILSLVASMLNGSAPKAKMSVSKLTAKGLKSKVIYPNSEQLKAAKPKSTCSACGSVLATGSYLRHVLIQHKTVNPDDMTYGATYYAQCHNLDLSEYGLGKYSLASK